MIPETANVEVLSQAVQPGGGRYIARISGTYTTSAEFLLGHREGLGFTPAHVTVIVESSGDTSHIFAGAGGPTAEITERGVHFTPAGVGVAANATFIIEAVY